MNRRITFLCIALALTQISFFEIGLASFTLFHFLAIWTLFVSSVDAFTNKNFSIKVPKYFCTLLFFVLFVNFFYIHAIKFTSFVYTLIILLELIILFNIVPRLNLSDIKRIIKIILLLYFINIFITSLLILFKIFPTGILAKVFQIYIFGGQIRPFGFSSEPSYAALIVVFSLYILFKAYSFSYKKEEIAWYVLAIVSVILTQSSYGYIFLAIVLMYFGIKSNLLLRGISYVRKNGIFRRKDVQIVFTLLIGAMFYIVYYFDFEGNKSIQRLVNILSSVATSDNDVFSTIFNIAKVDSSAGMRLVPLLHLINYFKGADIMHILIGHGAGQATLFYSKLYEQTTLLGFIPSFIYNYGIIGGLIAMFCFIYLFPKQKAILFFLFFLFLFNADFNTQIFLYILFTVMLAKQVENIQFTFHKNSLNE